MLAFVLLQLAYAIVLVATCAIAFRRGGRPEQAGAAMIAIGSVLTIPAASLPGLDGPAQLGVLAVDLLLLLGLLYLLISSDRFWPIWACGFHLVGVTTHVVLLFYPTVIPLAYKLVRGAWAYPMLLAIVLASSRRVSRTTVDWRA